MTISGLGAQPPRFLEPQVGSCMKTKHQGNLYQQKLEASIKRFMVDLEAHALLWGLVCISSLMALPAYAPYLHGVQILHGFSPLDCYKQKQRTVVIRHCTYGVRVRCRLWFFQCLRRSIPNVQCPISNNHGYWRAYMQHIFLATTIFDLIS